MSNVDHMTASAPAWLPSRRLLNGLGFLACALLLAFAYYLEYQEGLEPCPLCIFQRIAMFGLGFAFLAAALHDPRAWGARVYGVLIALFAALGAGLAGRQVWLMSLPPDQVPACGASLDYMLETWPLMQTLKTVLQGTGDCAENVWSFLGLSIPAWTLLWFVGMGLIGLVRNWMRAR